MGYFATIFLALQIGSAPVEHPVPLKPDTDTASCLECHAEKKQGKVVHAALEAGCTTCHSIEAKGEQTFVGLLSPEKELCTTCHEAEKKPVQHGPYETGECTACHNPHASDFPKLLVAETSTVCFSCHGVNQPGVEFDKQAKTVKLAGGAVLTFDEYRAAKKIGLDPSGASGHPIMNHPIEGIDPRDPNKKQKMTCLSCHVPHSSDLPDLMPAGLKRDIDLCSECHK